MLHLFAASVLTFNHGHTVQEKDSCPGALEAFTRSVEMWQLTEASLVIGDASYAISTYGPSYRRVLVEHGSVIIKLDALNCIDSRCHTMHGEVWLIERDAEHTCVNHWIGIVSQ